MSVIRRGKPKHVSSRLANRACAAAALRKPTSTQRRLASFWNVGLPKKLEAHMRSQQDGAGGLRHLITLDGLTRDALSSILDRAERYRRLPGQPEIGRA